MVASAHSVIAIGKLLAVAIMLASSSPAQPIGAVSASPLQAVDGYVAVADLSDSPPKIKTRASFNTRTVTPEEFIRIARKKMVTERIAALIVPTSDPHNSEYVAPRFQYRAKLSNFSGSAGTAVVTLDKALLWTDGRYWLEAEKSLPAGWVLQRAGMAGVPAMEDWLEEEQARAQYKEKQLFVGVDPYTYSTKAWEALEKRVQLKATNATRAAYAEVSANEPPAAPSALIVRLAQYSGETPTEKLGRVLAKVAAQSASSPRAIDALLVTALDDIAWLTNMRGVGDVPYNPVFIAYAIANVHDKKIHLFTNHRETTPEEDADKAKRTPVAAHCAAHGIELHPYEAIEAFLLERYIKTGKVIGVEEAQTNYALVKLIQEGGGKKAEARRVPSIISHLKGVKNVVELKGFEDSHIRDSKALVRFLAWLTDVMRNKGGVVNGRAVREADASDRLAAFRAEEALFRGPSFATISSSGPNGAVIHYHPTRGSDRALHVDELYLVDSGGQYEDGTTDVTRVLTFATEASMAGDDAKRALLADQRTAYTLVLKGHIALAVAVFPQGVSGHRLDALARQFLWADGLDYAHGTGHGVGSFLCVHEGPHSVPFRLPAAAVPLLEGMILSNEPGYYEDGSYGIRIENLVSVIPADPSKMRYPSGRTGQRDGAKNTTASLAFKQLTLVPYNRELIDVGMLTADEIKFVNEYHDAVREALLPLLEAHGDKLAVAYLKEHTARLV